MQVNHGKFNFLLGVSWHLPQDKKDIKALIGQRPGQSRVVVKAGESTWVGFDDERKSGVAAALVIASLYPDILLAERLPDDRYWLCVIHQGMPAPGRDIIVGADEAHSALFELVTFFPAARVFGDIEGSQGAVSEVWDQVLAAISGKEISPKKLRECSLKTVRTRRELVVIAAGALAVVAVAGAAWMVFKPKPPSPLELQNQKINDSQSQAQSKAERDRLDAIAASVKAYKDQLAAMGARIDQAKGQSFLPSWLKLFRSLPLSIDGYRPTNMTCTQRTCQIEWRGMVGALALDKFALEARTGALPRGAGAAPTTAAPGGPAPVVQLSNSMGDYGTLLEYSVEPVQRQAGQFVPSGVAATSFELLRARLLDLNTDLTHGKSQIQIAAPKPLTVAGVPQAQLPDALVAHVADLHLSVNGPGASHDLLHIDEQITRQLAGQGVALQWSRMVLMGSAGSDSIVADGEIYLVSPPAAQQ